MIDPAWLSLKVLAPAVSPRNANFRPTRWPPPADFPIVIDDRGDVISRYADPLWDLTTWAGKRLRIYFGDGAKSRSELSSANANELRQLVAFWLFGESGSYHPLAYYRRAEVVRPVFKLCSEYGIAASELFRFPKVQAELPRRLAPSTAEKVLALLHRVNEVRDTFGFTILDREGLRRLESALPEHDSRQTPYIPPRIWNYQVARLRDLLEDHLANHAGVEGLYVFALDMYKQRFGSMTSAYEARNRSKGRNMGSFVAHAEKFGVAELFNRWCAPDWPKLGIRVLSVWLDAVGAAAITYLANVSLMRIEEAASLRTDCLTIDDDDQFGPIYILTGETTKTIPDDDARWITSRSARIAVEAAAAVAHVRMIATCQNSRAEMTKGEQDNPYLFSRGLEPWCSAKRNDYHKIPTRRTPSCYEANLDGVPQLFAAEQLRITQDDLNIARLITPSLDPERFAVGKTWTFSNHQLRRTGAVNMQASGLVSDTSLQYQLKHASRACSLYYAQGRSRFRLNDSAHQEFVRTMYEIMSKEIAQLFTGRFISPLGEAHKREKLKFINPRDSKTLMAAAKAGRVSYRETLLGGCMKRGPCPFGGIDNIVRCGGGDTGTPCADALYDREKQHRIVRLGEIIASKLKDNPEDSPLRESLLAQQRSLANALDALAR